jgi:hypothetical protein
MEPQTKSQFGIIREFAPDNLPPLSIPFVIIDEACQSVEPASLIPIVSTNSCRSLVMLGDPCQVSTITPGNFLYCHRICAQLHFVSFRLLSGVIRLQQERHHSQFLSCRDLHLFQIFIR